MDSGVRGFLRSLLGKRTKSPVVGDDNASGSVFFVCLRREVCCMCLRAAVYASLYAASISRGLGERFVMAAVMVHRVIVMGRQATVSEYPKKQHSAFTKTKMRWFVMALQRK